MIDAHVAQKLVTLDWHPMQSVSDHWPVLNALFIVLFPPRSASGAPVAEIFVTALDLGNGPFTAPGRRDYSRDDLRHAGRVVRTRRVGRSDVLVVGSAGAVAVGHGDGVAGRGAGAGGDRRLAASRAFSARGRQLG